MIDFANFTENDKEQLRKLFFDARGKVSAAKLKLAKDEPRIHYRVMLTKIGFDDLVQALYHVLYGITEIPCCPTCGKLTTFSNFTNGYAKHCGNIACRKAEISAWASCYWDKITDDDRDAIIAKRKATNQVRYGGNTPMADPMAREKMKQTHRAISPDRRAAIIASQKQTCLSKFGYDAWAKKPEHRLQLSEQISAKFVDEAKLNARNAKTFETSFARYGTQWPQQSQQVIDKIAQTTIEHFGSWYSRYEHIRDVVGYDQCQTNEAAQQRVASLRAYKLDDLHKLLESRVKHGYEFGYDVDELCALYATGKKLEVQVKHSCGRSYISNIDGYQGPKLCKCERVRSEHERILVELCESFGVDVIVNDRALIGPKEVDIYIPSLKLAIEVNGAYWHQLTEQDEYERLMIFKKQKLEELGINLMVFFDFEIEQKLSIIADIIASKIGLTERIGARKCELVNVPKNEALIMMQHHLHGAVHAYSHALGLKYDDELVALAVFGKARSHKADATHELLRFVCLPGKTVVGGMGRLIGWFGIMVPGAKLLSYADLRISVGKAYETIGFQRLPDTKPNYFYVHSRTKEIVSRVAAQKHKLAELLSEKFDASKTEYANMENVGYLKVSDLGHRPYLLSVV